MSRYEKVQCLHVCADKQLQVPGRYEFIETLHGDVTVLNVYYRKPKGRFLQGLRKGWYYLNGYLKGYEYLRNKFGKPALVHLNVLFPAGLIAMLFKWKFGIPYVATEHWTGYLPANRRHYTGFFRKWLTPRIAAGAEVLMPVSEDLASSMKQLGFKGEYQIVYNVVDTSRFVLNNTAHRGVPRLLHISSLIDQHKNISGIMRVLARMRECGLQFDFTIVYDADPGHVKKLAAELGFDNSWFLMKGYLRAEEVAREMAIADALVMFSNYENLPCVMIEALACGLPVIATSVGGIPEHLNNDFGRLINPGDEQALEQVLEQVVNKTITFDAEKARTYAIQHFSYNQVGKAFSDIYSQVLTD